MENSEINLVDVQFKHPFTAIIAGPSGSGKTIFIRRVLKHSRLLINNLKFPLKVLWCYGQMQGLYSVPISPDVNVTYAEGMPDYDYISKHDHQIIILDDLMNEMDENKDLANLFTKGSHHLNKSIILCIQNLFHKNKIMRTISLNAHNIILMKNPRDKSQIMHLARQIYPKNPRILIEAYEEATSHPYSYIVIDLKMTTPDNLRIRSRITPEEVVHLNKTFSPIVYIPK
jgi:hypothetical protein